MSGFVPIPHAAISVARGPLQRGALLDLYSRAHQAEYAPLFVTDRDLSEDWGLSRGDVWKLLEGLQLVGCLDLEKAAPGSKRPSRVTVHPASSGLARQTERQTRSQTRSQKDEPPKQDIKISQPDPEPDPEPDRAPSCAEEIARASETRPDQTRPDQTGTQGGTRARATPPWSIGWPGHEPEAVVSAVRASAEAVRKAPIPDEKLSADAAVIGALWRGVGRPPLPDLVGRVELVALWAQESPGARNDLRGINERGEAWGTDRSRSPSTVLRPERFEERHQAALAWDRAGRPNGSIGPPARAAPKGQSSSTDGVLSRLFSRRNTTGEANNG